MASAMGTFYIFNSKPYCDPDNEEDNGCIEVLNPNILIFCFSFSGGNLPFIVAAELSFYVRGIVTCMPWLAATILLLGYEPYREMVNSRGVFFTFSFITFCAVLFVYKFIPETKGKTLEEIQKHFFQR